MSEMEIISWNTLPETVKTRLKNKWHTDLVNRYKAMGFGEPQDFEIERDQKLRIHYCIFIQCGHLYYECNPERI